MERDDDGTSTLLVKLDIGIGSGIIDLEKLDEHDVQLLARSIPSTRLKVNEADFFLKIMRHLFRHEAATHFLFNAFVTALRGVLDSLPQEVPESRKNEFRQWFAAKRRELSRNSDATLLLGFRNKAVHAGGHPPHLRFGVAIREHFNGERTAETIAELRGLGGKPVDDPLSACGRTVDALRALVDEADQRGFIKRPHRRGHTVQFRLLRETALGVWEKAEPEEMAMFGQTTPRFRAGEGVVTWPDGRTESAPPPRFDEDDGG